MGPIWFELGQRGHEGKDMSVIRLFPFRPLSLTSFRHSIVKWVIVHNSKEGKSGRWKIKVLLLSYFHQSEKGILMEKVE